MLAAPINDISYNAGMSEADGEQLRPESPTSHSMISRSKLVSIVLFNKLQEVQDQDLRRIETEVREHLIKRKSTKKEDQ